jgi:hypothetical protein
LYFHIVNQITMLRRASTLLLVFIFCTSCDYFSQSTSTSSSNLQVLDTVIDYTSVDVYPIFSDCENYAESDSQKKCFEASITEKLAEILSDNEFKVNNEVNDTTSIDILIDHTGKASLMTINSPKSIVEELPNLESIIRKGINQLPTMKPALKRGMFVKSQYRLVIVVETI